MSFFVYGLESKKDGRHYVGSGEDVDERLRRHNLGDYRYTKGHRPWIVIYKESCKSRSEAVKRERFFKSGVGRKFLKEIISSK
ncbi:MAG: GIY-YIG nuclease family protein [Candidatus Omnitrophota bacterium]